MKAAYFERFGGPDVLRYGERPDPAPGPGEALVRVRACGINHLDLWVRSGLRGLEPEMPHVLGNDVVGEIVAVGPGVGHVAPGRKTLVNPTLSCGVCAACANGDDNLCRSHDVIGRRRNGGYAELVAVPAANCLPYPDNLAWEQAAAVPLVFLTAWHMLVTRARVRPGEDVLVIGAGSGVGSAAVQVARLHGARVIATAGSTAKRARAHDLGAHETIDHASEDVAKRARELTGRKGVEVVVEHVGGRVFEAGVAALARDGRLVTCGATLGNRAALDLDLLFGRHLTLLGSWMGRRSDLNDVLRHVASGALKPVVDSVRPLAEARAAHERIEAREHFGKLVLVP
jgi:NADPH:quinone reductase-like Zn-dependent oxidoreductase